MGIEGKEIVAILWKVLGFSMNTSIKFMRNHPILSGVSMFLLVLYIFLPSLLFFLIYSSPVFVCALFYAQEKLGLRFFSSYKLFSSSKSDGFNGDKRTHLKQQRSVRRNARMKVEEWDSQTSEEEKDKIILTSLYNDLLGRTPQFEDSPKALETNLVEEGNDKAFAEEEEEEVSRDLGQTFCNCEIKYEESDGNEEMKAEMDNVNEHGISEIERNRRLESLISRRRTRRLFRLALDQRNKLQADETISPRRQNNNLQVTISRDSFENRRSYSSDGTVVGLQIPGSAPSVMLQGRNPFDIPYDPQEERPNLTGDSFDEEFSLFDHKDLFFCRHESFCRYAHFPPEHVQYMNNPISASDLNNEYLDHVEQKLSSNDKEPTIKDDDNSLEGRKSGEGEVEMNDETDSNEEESDDSSCSEESESELSPLNNSELRKAICQSMDNYHGVHVHHTRNNIPSTLPRGLVAPRLDDNSMFYTRRNANSHNRTFSVASDMQVEVSDIGSPPTTVDWPDDMSNGGESYIYDTDIDREIVRDEGARKMISYQNESRSGIGSKDENNGPHTKPMVKPDHNCVEDEHLRRVDDMSLLDSRSHVEENIEQKPSTSNDVSKPTSYEKFDGLLFHTSASLSSITEEPETILDSIDRRNSENLKCLTDEFTDQRSQTTQDSSMKELMDEEVVDVQQVENDDLCKSPKVIESNIIDHPHKDQISYSIQGEHDTEIMKKSENTKPEEYEATKSLLDASLDTPYTKSFEREANDEESNLNSITEEVTRQIENEAHQSDLKSSPCHALTECLESEVIEDNNQELVKSIEEKAKPIEEEKANNILEESSSHPYTQLTEDYGNEDNTRDMKLLQVQDSNKSRLDESPNKEISKEEEKLEIHDESIQEYKNRVNVEEESVVSAGNEKTQGSQPCTQQFDIDSSEGISPRTLEITKQVEKEDVIVPNTVSQNIDGDEVVVLANDSAASNNSDEDHHKLNKQVKEDMENELELDLKSLDHNIGLVGREDDEEFKKVTGEMQNVEIQKTES